MQAKVSLVTGSARRVGAAIIRILHGAGSQVAIHYHRSHQDAERLAAELEAVQPNSTLLVQGNLLHTDDLPRLIEETVDKFGRLDVLVNNASSFYPTPLGQITGDAWADLMGTNLKAPLFLSQAAAPELRRSHGVIINIVDIYAERPLKGYAVYSIAKAGLAGLTKSLSRELGPEVRVNGVAPGVAMWPEDAELLNAAKQQAVIEHTSLKRAGTPEDIAGAVKFLAFEAPYVTGQILNVDGGRL